MAHIEASKGGNVLRLSSVFISYRKRLEYIVKNAPRHAINIRTGFFYNRLRCLWMGMRECNSHIRVRLDTRAAFDYVK